MSFKTIPNIPFADLRVFFGCSCTEYLRWPFRYSTREVQRLEGRYDRLTEELGQVEGSWCGLDRGLQGKLVAETVGHHYNSHSSIHRTPTW